MKELEILLGPIKNQNQDKKQWIIGRYVCCACIQLIFMKFILYGFYYSFLFQLNKLKLGLWSNSWPIPILSNSNFNQGISKNKKILILKPYHNYYCFYDVPIEIHMLIVRIVPSQATHNIILLIELKHTVNNTFGPNLACFIGFISHYYTNTLIFCKCSI